VILVQKVWTNTSHVASWIAMLKDVIREEFEDIKGAIRIRISKKKRQQKKYYRTNNDLQNIDINLKIKQHEPH
jgi:hypothetical protein